jgi:hypothetical protein
VHCGDSVSYNRQRGTVVFVIDHGEYASDFPEADWSHHGHGFMIRFDNGGLLMLEDGDELLSLLGRTA